MTEEDSLMMEAYGPRGAAMKKTMATIGEEAVKASQPDTTPGFLSRMFGEMKHRWGSMHRIEGPKKKS
jgi:hypothetical protein